MNDTPLPVVFIVDGESTITIPLKRLLKTAGLDSQTFSSAQEFMKAELPDVPGCLALDVNMPGMSGLELQQRPTQAEIDTPIVFITRYAEVPVSVRAMKAGTVEFLTKPFGAEEVLEAIQRGIEKHRSARQQRARFSDLKHRYHALTRREAEVFLLVTRGLLNKQVAAALGTSEKTIKVHRGQVMQKMNAPSLPELVLMAAELKLDSNAA